MFVCDSHEDRVRFDADFRHRDDNVRAFSSRAIGILVRCETERDIGGQLVRCRLRNCAARVVQRYSCRSLRAGGHGKPFDPS